MCDGLEDTVTANQITGSVVTNPITSNDSTAHGTSSPDALHEKVNAPLHTLLFTRSLMI